MSGGAHGGAFPLVAHDALPPSVVEILTKAQTSWLKNPDVVDILENYTQYGLVVSSEPPVQPPGGTLFLFNRRECRFFRKDGHNWRKKPDGKTVRETHEKLKVGNQELLNCYYAHADQEESGQLLLQRRCYWLLDESQEHIVLVHYLNSSTSRAGVAIGQRPGSATDLAAAGGQQRPQRGAGGRRRAGGSAAGTGPPPSPQERPARAAAATPSPGYMPPRMQLPGRAAAGRRPAVEEESGAGMSLDRGASLMDDAAGGSISLGRLASLSDIGMNPEYGLPSLQQQYLQRFGGPPPPPPPHAAAFAFPQHSWWQGQGPGQGQGQAQGQGRGGMEPEPPGGFNSISAREHDAALAFAGQFGQALPPHHPASHPPLPPAARSLLYTLSMGADGEAQRGLIPEVSLGLSRLSGLDENSFAQFLTDLEQSLEARQAIQMAENALGNGSGNGGGSGGAGGAAGGGGPGGEGRPGVPRSSSLLTRNSSGFSRLLQLVGDAYAGNLGDQLAPTMSWLAQLPQLSSLPAPSQPPNWHPDLDIQLLDREGGPQAGQGGLRSPPMHSRSLFRIESTAGTGRGRREEGPGPHPVILPRQLRQQQLRLQQQQQVAVKREERGDGDSEETQDKQAEEAGETGAEEAASPAGGAAQAQQAGRGPQARAAALEGLMAKEQQGQPGGGLQPGQQEFSFGRGGMVPGGSGRVLEKQESSVQQAAARRGSMPPPPHFARPLPSPPRWGEEDEGAVRGGSTPQQQARRAGEGGAAPLAVRPKPSVGRRLHEHLSPQEDARSPPRHDGGARRSSGGREADVVAAGHERMEAQLRRARVQRITSMDTDSSAPIMLHHVGSEHHLEDAQLTVPLKPDQLPPQLAQRSGSRDVMDEDVSGEGRAAAAAAAAPAGPPAKLQPTQSALARAATAAELADGVEVAVAAAGNTGAPEALALIQQLNQLKQQVIQHLLASGHVKQEQQEEGGERPAGRQQQQQQQQQEEEGSEKEERGSGERRASESTPSKGQAADSKQQQPGRGRGAASGGTGSQSLAAQASSGGSGGEGPPLGEPNRSVTSLMQALGMSAPSHGTAAASPSQAPSSSMEVEKRESHPASSGAVGSGQQPAAESSGAASSGEVRFRVTDYTPDWDFTAGGAKVIITGALSGEAAAGGSPPFSIRFGSEVVSATTVFPGVLRCTVPPTAAPGRVPLVVLGPDSEPASEPVVFEYRPAMQQDGSGSVSAGAALPAAELADRELQMRLIQTLLGYRAGSGALDPALPSPVSQLGSVGPSRDGSGGWAAAADMSLRTGSGSSEPHPLPKQQQQQQQEPMAAEQLHGRGSGRLGPRSGRSGGALDEGSNNLTRSAVAALVGGGGPGGSTQQDLLAAAMDRLPTVQREEMLQLLIQREVAELGAAAGGSGAMECDNENAEGEGGSKGAGGSSGAAAAAAARDINSLGAGGQALIHTFAGLGYDWAISVLAAAGADVNLVDAAGLTPLHWAAARGHEAAVGELLARGADPARLAPATPSAAAKLPADLAADNGHSGMAAYLAEAALTWAWNRMQDGGTGSGGGSGSQQGSGSATAGRKRSRPGLGGSGGAAGGLGGLQGGVEGGDFAKNAAVSAKNVAAAIEDRYRQQQNDGSLEQQGRPSEQGPPGRAGSQDVFGLLGQGPAGAPFSEYQHRLGTTVGHVEAMLNSGPARGQYMRMKQAGSAVGQRPPIALSPFDQRAAAPQQQQQGGVPTSSRLKYARTNTLQAQVPFEWRCFSGDFSDVVAQREQEKAQQEQQQEQERQG